MASQRIALKAANTLSVEEVTWEKVRSAVQKTNRVLADIIDEFNPSNKYTFVLARYPFGVEIRQKGIAYFPNDKGGLLSFDDPQTSPLVKNLLSYSPSPLGFILNKSVEVFVETPEKRTVPFKIFNSGTTFGVWEILNFPEILVRQSWDWSISSGGRTVFTPASINETISFSRLQRAYQIKNYMPDTIFDHRNIFAEIAHHSEQNWCTEILFFSKKWVEPQEDNLAWTKLRNHWANEAWKQFHYWVNKMTMDFNWEIFIAELTNRKILLKSYLLDTLKHLIAIGCGTIPAFRAVEDESVLPLKVIQDALVNDYQLKQYAPIVMQPDFLKPQTNVSAVYYSLQYPTLPEKPSDLKSFPSTMKLLRELKQHIEIFYDLSSGWPRGKNNFDFLENIHFDYFHSDKDKYQQTQNLDQLVKDDSCLQKNLNAYPERRFPEGSHFFRGCIRVAFRENKVVTT